MAEIRGGRTAIQSIFKEIMMYPTQALEIIEKLAFGVNPYTHKALSAKSPCRHIDTVQALYAAMAALKRVQKIRKKEARQRNIPQNSGKPWNKSEERQLVDAFDSGKTIEQIAEKHQRTKGAINARLVNLGKIDDSSSF